MDAQLSPLPAGLPPTDAPHADLETRIRQAELRLITREENLRRGVRVLSQRVREQMQPRKLLLPAVGAGAALVGLGALWARGRVPAGATRVGRGAAGAGGPPPPRRGEMPWVRLVALGWPLLPVHWRNRISPATASTIVALGLPLAERLVGRPKVPLDAVPQVDLARCTGRWTVVASTGRGQAGAPLDIALRRDGALEGVLQPEAPVGADKPAAPVTLTAHPVPGSHGARLEVSAWPEWLQWLPQAWTERVVLHVDERCNELLVGSPARDVLLVLARRPRLAPSRLQALLMVARDQGFDVERLRFHGER